MAYHNIHTTRYNIEYNRFINPYGRVCGRIHPISIYLDRVFPDPVLDKLKRVRKIHAKVSLPAFVNSL